MILLAIITVIILLYGGYKMYLKQFLECAKSIPGRDNCPIIGDALDLYIAMKNKGVNEYFTYLIDMAKEFSEFGLMRIWLGPILVIPVWEPCYIQELIKNPNAARKGRLFEYLLGIDLIKGAFINEGDEEWKSLSKPLKKSMSKNYLEGRHYEVIKRRTKEFINYLKSLEKTKIDNILHELMRLNLEIFGETHLGVAEPVENISIFLPMLSKYIERRTRLIFKVWPFVLTFFITPFKDIIKFGYESVQFVINYRRKYMQGKRNEDHPDGYEYYTDYLIRRGEARGFNDRRIGMELIDAVVAGSDTISGVLSSLLVFLGMHPEVQEEVYREQLAVMGSDPMSDPGQAELAAMELLSRAISETLRLVNAPFIHKQPTADITLGEYKIPKGAYVLVGTAIAHRNARYWERPDQFFPDHFLPERVKARPEFAFIPFGLGIRRCPGEQYARISIAAAASFITRNFKFSSKWKMDDVRFRLDITNHFQLELYELDFELRQHY